LASSTKNVGLVSVRGAVNGTKRKLRHQMLGFAISTTSCRSRNRWRSAHGDLVDPKTFKLKLLKEIRQRPAANQSRRLIGGKATAFDPHAHRFAASHNSPAPGEVIVRGAILCPRHNDFFVPLMEQQF
jgi:hypothetical protein